MRDFLIFSFLSQSSSAFLFSPLQILTNNETYVNDLAVLLNTKHYKGNNVANQEFGARVRKRYDKWLPIKFQFVFLDTKHESFFRPQMNIYI